MSKAFPAAAHEALRNTQLRRNLHVATTTIRGKRAAVTAERPDWEELRSAGEALKRRVLRHLDHYLLQFESAVTQAGGVVHWARDAEDANEIVTGLVLRTGAREVVKVKSLTTDEIGVNDALAAVGVTAIETDLAELICQLAGDEPSHILVPAIHKNRVEIRDLFRRELGQPELTDEPSVLAAAARAYLRETVPRRVRRDQRGELRRRRDGHGVRRRVRGERAVLHDAAEDPRHDPRDREAGADARGSRGVPPAAAAVVHWRANEPVHVALDGRDARRRAAGVSRRASRQRTNERPRGSGRTPDARLHSLQRVSQRLPGVLANRRSRVRLGLSGADRRDSHAAAPGDGRGRLAAVRLEPVRRLCRGVPRQDRHPAGPRSPSSAASSAKRSEAMAPERLAMKGAARALGSARRFRRAQWLGRLAQRPFVDGEPDRAGCPASRAGRARATCPAFRRDPSATGGASDDARGRSSSREWPPRFAMCRRTSGPRTSRYRVSTACRRAATSSSGSSSASPSTRRRSAACRPTRWPPSQRIGAACAASDGSASRPTCRSTWRPAGVERRSGRALDARALDALDGAMTGCALAIAETGTDRSRRGRAPGRACALARSGLPPVRRRRGRRSSAASPRHGRHRRDHPPPPSPSDPDLGALRNVGHRALARRGRPRPANARCAGRGAARDSLSLPRVS